MINDKFSIPSPAWRWGLFIYTIVISIWFIHYISPLFQEAQLDEVRFELILGYINLFIAYYQTINYQYLKWVTPLKNQLNHIYLRENSLIFKKYNRLHINEDILIKYDLKPEKFKGIRQEDLRSIFVD